MILFKLPERYLHDRPNVEILKRIPENATRILDVGCNTGATVYAFKKSHPCYLAGIEPNPEPANIAKTRLELVIKKDVNKVTAADLGFPEEGPHANHDSLFDCVIFGDVLEHLENPWATLKEYTAYLKEDGTVIASIPNFQHRSIQEALKKGALEYEAQGLMDRTHLRHFTLSSIFQLFAQADLKIVDYSPEGSREKAYQYTVTAKHIPQSQATTDTTIIILNWNTFPYVKACIESIQKNTQPRYKIILVDNGSLDGCVQWAREQPNVITIENEVNLGFAPGCNQAIAATDTPYIMLLNGDTLVRPGWLTALTDTANSDPDIGIVGAKSFLVAGHQQDRQAKYKTVKDFEEYSTKVLYERAGETQEVDWVVFFAALIKREVFEKVGLLDPQFAYGGHDDLDFSWRARQAGFKCVVDHSVYIHHYWKKSSEANESDYWGLLKKAREDFCRKWGVKQSPL